MAKVNVIVMALLLKVPPSLLSSCQYNYSFLFLNKKLHEGSQIGLKFLQVFASCGSLI